jgi:hypothetical protein
MENLKQRIEIELNELRSDYGDEEVDNTLEVLESLNDDLSDMGKWDETLLTRLIDDKDLLKEIYAIRGENTYYEDEDAF